MQGPPNRSPPQSPQTFHQHPRGHQHAPQPAQPAKPTKAYNPRHPERTLLYRTIAETSRLGLSSPAQDSLTVRAMTTPRRSTWRRHSANIWSAASLPTALRGCVVTIAVTTTWSPSPAKAVAYAPHATHVAWPRRLRTCATMCSLAYRCANGYCRCPNAFATRLNTPIPSKR
jgi:hypothetical protein